MVLNRNRKFIKCSNFVVKNIGNESVIVPLINNVAQMKNIFSLNELGAFIYENLDGEKSVEAIVALITQTYQIDENSVWVDLEEFINVLLERGIIK